MSHSTSLHRPVRSRGSSFKHTYHARPSSRHARHAPKKDYINPSRFIKAARPVEAVTYQPAHQFADFPVETLIKRNITAKGLVSPTPIQDQSIPVGLSGSDVIGIANTGTGKTIAFAIPVLQRLFTEPHARALIMAPTRELAEQIQSECKAIGKGSGLYGALLIGGAAMGPQLRDLRAVPSIVIGTPGRIKDHVERGTLDLSNFNIAVLDEVDRMLDMGFVHDMREILALLSAERQSFFFSATLDHKVRALIDEFSTDPVMVSVKTGDTSDNVEQNIVHYTTSDEKISKLHDILIDEHVVKALVFGETQRSVERLSGELASRGFKVDAIHGGKSQGQRKRALDKFKQNVIDVLVATDVAARGIDVADISHVINYALPQSYEDYVHRIGRAGRAGRTGNALTFVSRTDY